MGPLFLRGAAGAHCSDSPIVLTSLRRGGRYICQNQMSLGSFLCRYKMSVCLELHIVSQGKGGAERKLEKSNLDYSLVIHEYTTVRSSPILASRCI